MSLSGLVALWVKLAPDFENKSTVSSIALLGEIVIKINTAKCRDYSTHYSSFSKPGAYITHNATEWHHWRQFTVYTRDKYSIMHMKCTPSQYALKQDSVSEYFLSSEAWSCYWLFYCCSKNYRCSYLRSPVAPCFQKYFLKCIFFFSIFFSLCHCLSVCPTPSVCGD